MVPRRTVRHAAVCGLLLVPLIGGGLAGLGGGLALACSRGAPPPPAPVADPVTRRDPAAGPVVGFVGGYGQHTWLGLPYAAPPVGEQRWRAPAPTSWSEPHEALAFGASCPQFASSVGGDDSAEPGTPIGSEDCLTLNVYAPPLAPDDVLQASRRQPVMVWIHGGGNTIGTSRFYNGGHLAARHKLVVVTVNYRLGALGWFRHPALAEGASAEERSGNFATLDLIAALRWVRDNIAAFGGNPDYVTVFGESAGGTNVMTLLLSPQAEGLFHRAIVQSGGTRSVSVAEAENPVDAREPGHRNSGQEVALRMLVEQGDARDREDALRRARELGPHPLAARLRALTADALLRLYDDGRGLGMYDAPRVIRDGVVLPEAPFEEVLVRGPVNRVPLILGTNRDEQKLFLYLNPEYVRRWFGVFPQVLDRPRYMAEARLHSRLWKATGADEPALSLAARPGDPVFVYRFDWDEEPRVLWADLGELLGAAHGFEIPFVFGHFDLGRQGRFLFNADNEPGRSALADTMMSYWAQFARTGDPGTGRDEELPRWTPFDPAPGAARTLLLDTPAGGGARMDDELVTVARVVEELRTDPYWAERDARCDALATVAERSGRFGAEDYAREGCGTLPQVAESR